VSHSEQLSEREVLAYMAGLVDGEGYIGIRKNIATFQALIQISMTHQDVIRWVHTNFDGTFEIVDRASKEGSNQEIIYRWTLSSKDKVLQLLEALYPFLIVKRLHCAIAVEFCRKFNNQSNGKRYSANDKAIMAMYYDVMAVANDKGPGSTKNKIALFNVLLPKTRESSNA